MANTPTAIKPPRIERLSLRSWAGGYNSNLDIGRTPEKSLTRAQNVLLYQDGTVGPRPSLVPYGPEPLGTILGEVYEFKNSDNGERGLITVQRFDTVATIAVRINEGIWQVVNGKNFNINAMCHFKQIDNKVLIMNGEDNLSYYDLNTHTVVPFVALTTPTAPTITATGLSGTTYTYYYRITANSTVGETAGSVAASKQVSLIRGAWDTTTNYLTINWTAVPNAKSYNVYIGETADQQYLVASALTGTSWKDDGTATKDVTRTVPVGDTTEGPRVERAEVINGQVFFTGDKDKKSYVRYGGKGTAVLDLSPYGGGGWFEIGKGTKEIPVAVKPFRTGTGTPTPMILTQGTNGYGKRYTAVDATVNVGDDVINYFDVKEDNGQDGTDSPDAVVVHKDQLIYPSRDGFKSTFTKAQVQSILTTRSLTEAIAEDVVNLNVQAMNSAVGLPYNDRIYFALPVGSIKNNQMWVLDLSESREGGWVLPLTIPCDWQTLYEDSKGITHHLILSNNNIYEMTEQQDTMDDGTPFSTNISSGQLRFSEDGEEWATVTRVTFVFLRSKGEIEVSVGGKTEDDDFATVAFDNFKAVNFSSVAGWGESEWGSLGWSQSVSVPTAYGNARKKVTLEIEEDMNWVTWNVASNAPNTKYQLSDVIIEFVRIGLLDSDD